MNYCRVEANWNYHRVLSISLKNMNRHIHRLLHHFIMPERRRWVRFTCHRLLPHWLQLLLLILILIIVSSDTDTTDLTIIIVLVEVMHIICLDRPFRITCPTLVLLRRTATPSAFLRGLPIMLVVTNTTAIFILATWVPPRTILVVVSIIILIIIIKDTCVIQTS